MRGRACLTAAAAAAAAALACSSSTGPSGSTRTYRMGFSDFPPKLDVQAYLDNLDAWQHHADAAIMHLSPPWTALLAGGRPDSLVLAQNLQLANRYRASGFELWVTMDLTNGLDRAAEHPDLVAAGRSITEPAVQQLERSWLVAFDTIIRPDYLGLAAETNLIRLAAPASLYQAVVTLSNAGAADVLAKDPARKLYVSVQVDAAWGRLGGPPNYIGVEQDYADFPFIAALGLSSYPYFAYNDPADVPLDYYTRLRNGRATPMMVVEGGWTSASVGTVVSDPAKEARYISRQRLLLDSAHAIAWFQLDFPDFDTTGFHLPAGSIAPLFAHLGLVDVNLIPKPALAVWDSAFDRPRVP